MCVVALTGTYLADRALRRDQTHSENSMYLPWGLADLSLRYNHMNAADDRMGKQTQARPAAVDFSLPSVKEDRIVRLTDLRGKIAVLIFGSFSCDLFCDQAAELEQLYQDFKDRMSFLLVQIHEAGHDIQALDAALRDFPKTTPNRRERARRAMEVLNLTMPGVTDGPDRAIEQAYSAFPKRLVVLDENGRRAVDIGWGRPAWDFEYVREQLRKLLTTRSPS